MPKPLVYLAGPLFSDQDREMLIKIEQRFTSSGIDCFLPHREVGDLCALKKEIGEEAARNYIFDSDMSGVRECAVLCALLDGSDVDSGTAAEMGFAHSLGKPVFGLCTDAHRRGRTMNNVMWGICGSGEKIYHAIDDLVVAITDALVRSSDLRLSDLTHARSSGQSRNAYSTSSDGPENFPNAFPL